PPPQPPPFPYTTLFRSVTEEVPQGQPAQVTMRPPHGRARPAPAGDPCEGAAAVRTRPRHLRVEAFSLPGTPSPGGERPLEGGPWRPPKRWTPSPRSWSCSAI